MSDVSEQVNSTGPIQLMLVDEDPVFRLGLKVWLEQQGDFVVAAEASTAADALDKVRSRFIDYQAALDDPARRKKDTPPVPPIDLVLLDLGIGAKNPDAMPGLSLCQQIKTDFPQLPVVVLSAQAEPVLQAAAERMGANGYGTRSMSVRRLAQLIRQAASAEKTPQSDADTNAVSGKNADPNSDSAAGRNPQSAALDPTNQRRRSALSRLDDIPGPLTAMRISMRLSGLRQIDKSIADVNLARQQTASWLNRAILDGKKRELTAARWLMSTLWHTPRFGDRPQSGRRASGFGTRDAAGNSASTDWIRFAQQNTGSYGDRTAARYLDRGALMPSATAALEALSAQQTAALQGRPGDVQNAVFEGVFAKLQRPLNNISESPLEIDILRPEKKLELLYLVLRQLEELLADLRASQVLPGQISTRSTQVIRDLWDAVNTDFFGKYYTVQIGAVEEEVITLLQQEKSVVQSQILDQIPLLPELFGHWLFQESLIIEGSAYLATTPQAIAYSERLLENLMIQVANAVIQPLLNRMADTEQIKKSLYTGRLMSSREIERFRNDLSWRYRLDRLIHEPKAIFESRYNLFVLTANGIDLTTIYAPRRAELDQLTGIPLVVTLALETRDALSPRLRTAISFIGSSVVYVLTEVLGRGIGLVGRGIFKGMGSAFQDGKGNGRRGRDRYPGQQTYQNPYSQNPYQSRYADNPQPQDYNEWE
ncbi:MAG: DUF3685 domain-containing protein [Cyanobacteria bacterium J06632_3]